MTETSLIQRLLTTDGVSDFERGLESNITYSPTEKGASIKQSTDRNLSAGILSLGFRRDATTWKKGCIAVGLNVERSITDPNPTLNEIEIFFKSKPDWIYFGGHFGGGVLYNEGETIDIEFNSDKIILTHSPTPQNPNTIVLRKHSNDFTLDKKCKVMLWGGCSVCSSEANINNLRNLFNNPLILGFAGSTGWRIVDALLGGSFIKNHFFVRIKGNLQDLNHVRNEWLRTALYGYGGTMLESRFRAIDPNGQEWKLSNKEIVKGRLIR